MIKHLVLILFIFILNAFSAQNWIDEIKKARLAYKTNKYTKSLHHYQIASKIKPANIDLSMEMAQAFYKAKSYQNAAVLYKNMIGSKTKADLRSSAYHNLGNIAFQQKNYPRAIESYKKSLRINPSNSQTRYNLSEAIRQLKKEKEKEKNPKSTPKSKNQKQNSPKQKKNKTPESQAKSKLAKSNVDRILDKLMKSEAETKRKMNDKSPKNNSINNEKDW